MTLLLFSIMMAAPESSTSAVMATTARCQPRLPKAVVAWAKYAPASPANRLPLMLPHRLRSTQPMMME